MNELSEQLRSVVFDCSWIPDRLCDDCNKLAEIANRVEDLEWELAYLKTRLAWHEGTIRG